MEQLLRKTVIALITKKDARAFYVGTHGEFARMVYRVPKDISHIHDIVIYVVPAYIRGGTICYTRLQIQFFRTEQRTFRRDLPFAIAIGL